MESKRDPTPLFEVPTRRSSILGGIRIVLVSLPLGFHIGAVLTFGSRFLFALDSIPLMMAAYAVARVFKRGIPTVLQNVAKVLSVLAVGTASVSLIADAITI